MLKRNTEDLEDRMKVMLAPEEKRQQRDENASIKHEDIEADLLSQDSIIHLKQKKTELIGPIMQHPGEQTSKCIEESRDNGEELKAIIERTMNQSIQMQTKKSLTSKQQEKDNLKFMNSSQRIYQHLPVSIQQSTQQLQSVPFLTGKKKLEINEDDNQQFDQSKEINRQSRTPSQLIAEQLIGNNQGERDKKESQQQNQTTSYPPFTVPNTSMPRNSLQQGSFPLFQSRANANFHSSHAGNHIGNTTSNQANGAIANIKLIAQTKRRVMYFFKKFTASGRREFLAKNQVRRRIDDKSDITSSSESMCLVKAFNALTNLIFDRQGNDEESEANYLLNPHEFLSLFGFYFFSVFNSVFFLIYSILIIYKAPMESDNFIRGSALTVWFLEIFFQINTKFYMGSHLVADRQIIFANYIKTRAIFDIIAIALMIFLPDEDLQKTICECLTFVKLKNLMPDIKKMSKQLCMTFKNYYLLQLINLIVKILVIGHIIACSYYLVGLIELHLMGYETTWYDEGLATDYVWWKLYLESLYWSLTLLTTGSNIAYTVPQLFFTTFIMLFTTIIFGYLLNVTGAIISQFDAEESSKQLDLNIVNEYMRQNKISKSLQTRVNLDIENYYESNIAFQQGQQQALNKISPTLQNLLKLEYCYQILERFTLIKEKFSPQLIEDISMEIEEVYYLPNQLIFEQSKQSDIALLFIINGSVEISQTPVTDATLSRQIGRLYKGQLLGTLNFFTGVQYDKSARSKEFTKVVKLDREKFLNIVSKRDKDLQIFSEIRDKLLMYENYDCISQKCVLCNASTHLELECHLVHIQKDEIYQKVKFFQNITQERSKAFRKIMKVKLSGKKLKEEILKFRKIYKPNRIVNMNRKIYNSKESFELDDPENQEQGEISESYINSDDEDEYTEDEGFQEDWRDAIKKDDFDSDYKKTQTNYVSNDEDTIQGSPQRTQNEAFKKVQSIKPSRRRSEDQEECLTNSQKGNANNINKINNFTNNNMNNYSNHNYNGNQQNQSSFYYNQQSQYNYMNSFNNNSFSPFNSLTASNNLASANNNLPINNNNNASIINNNIASIQKSISDFPSSNSHSNPMQNTPSSHPSSNGNVLPMNSPQRDKKDLPFELILEQNDVIDDSLRPRRQFRNYTTTKRHQTILSYNSSNRQGMQDGQSHQSSMRKGTSSKSIKISNHFTSPSNNPNSITNLGASNSNLNQNQNMNSNQKMNSNINNSITPNVAQNTSNTTTINNNNNTSNNLLLSSQAGQVKQKPLEMNVLGTVVKNEEIIKMPSYNEWDFDKLKDYKFYFSKGNSKLILVKYLRSQRKRLKPNCNKKKLQTQGVFKG